MMLAKIREAVNGLTHFFTAIIALIGLIALIIIGWKSVIKEISLSIHRISLILLFAASATYHMVKAKPKIIENLRKFEAGKKRLRLVQQLQIKSLLKYQNNW